MTYCLRFHRCDYQPLRLPTTEKGFTRRLRTPREDRGDTGRQGVLSSTLFRGPDKRQRTGRAVDVRRDHKYLTWNHFSTRRLSSDGLPPSKCSPEVPSKTFSCTAPYCLRLRKRHNTTLRPSHTDTHAPRAVRCVSSVHRLRTSGLFSRLWPLVSGRTRATVTASRWVSASADLVIRHRTLLRRTTTLSRSSLLL